ncbi:MAG TPA: class I SAM-dependent methyltransferase [Bacillota bacterium]
MVIFPASEVVIRRYDRLSPFYDFCDRMGRPVWRRKVFERTRGEVLEVGVGTGKNMPFYRPGTVVTAIDIAPGMLARARRRLGEAAAPVHLMRADVQALPFADDSFDTVVDTFVFCSVPDPVLGLREIARVCRPDGLVLMMEHVRAVGRITGALMDALNPLVVRVVGANINRRTVENVRLAGLSLVSVEDLGMKGIVKLITARPAKGPGDP